MLVLSTRFTNMLQRWLWIVAVFPLASCVITEDYPAHWARLQAIDSTEAQGCPTLTGVYGDFGERDRNQPSERFWDHISLIYNLLSSESHSIRSRGHVSRDIEHLIGNAIEIKQPHRDTLEIIAWRVEANHGFMLQRQILSSAKGDFGCGSEGLSLKTRPEVWIRGLANFVGSVGRTLNRSDDGALIMKIRESFLANHTIFPFSGIKEYWIRWQPSADFHREKRGQSD